MKTLALVATMLLSVACTNEDQPDPGEVDVGKTVLEFCGAAPLAPGWSVAFKDGVATMSTADFNAISTWRDEVAAWRDCTVGIGVVK
jgi:hypothetical protein